MERLSHVVTNGQLSGVDISRQAVKNAWSRFKEQTKSDRISIHETNIEKIQLSPSLFNKICSVNTIY
jgi:cyclopropane fatty-acyl-phospholipid synthase-like methyltransferase